MNLSNSHQFIGKLVLRALIRRPIMLAALLVMLVGATGCQPSSNPETEADQDDGPVTAPTALPAATGPDTRPVEIPLEQPLSFSHLTTADGLSEGRVWDIMQDSRGFMWLTTWEGLNRYDGYEIKVHRQERDNLNSPGGSGFFEVFEDRQGMISGWLAYRRGTESF